MSKPIFKNFTTDLNENFLKEFDKIAERVKNQKYVANILQENLIDNFVLSHILTYHSINHISLDELVNGFKLMLENNKDKIDCLKRK